MLNENVEANMQNSSVTTLFPKAYGIVLFLRFKACIQCLTKHAPLVAKKRILKTHDNFAAYITKRRRTVRFNICTRKKQ